MDMSVLSKIKVAERTWNYCFYFTVRIRRNELLCGLYDFFFFTK